MTELLILAGILTGIMFGLPFGIAVASIYRIIRDLTHHRSLP